MTIPGLRRQKRPGWNSERANVAEPGGQAKKACFYQAPGRQFRPTADKETQSQIRDGGPVFAPICCRRTQDLSMVC